MASRAKLARHRTAKARADADQLRKELRANALKRHEQIAGVAASRIAVGLGQTYLQFHTSGGHICDFCCQLDEIMLPIDSPIWRFCTPLCHDLCKCFFTSLTNRELKDYNLKVSEPPTLQIQEYRDAQTGRIVQGVAGIQPGFGQWDWEGAIRRRLDAYLRKIKKRV